VKSQIAYASIAQIGLIFIEVAAGLENLAMFHFAGNAFFKNVPAARFTVGSELSDP
jgi:NADH-quinone oxidoreductase subunit L